MSDYKISKLQVTNFRNLRPDIIDFSKGINCILGNNGNGKTNILEAIHILITKKSFRKNTGFPQFLSIECEKPEVVFSSVFSSADDSNFSYSAKYQNGSSQWFKNGKAIKSRVPIGVVFINPFDSYGFHLQASHRRDWFDHHMGILDKEFKSLLSRYNGLLKFRNSLLGKKPPKYREQIAAIGPEFAKYSRQITEMRKKFIEDLKSFCSATFHEVFSETHYLNIVLESKLDGLSEAEIITIFDNGFARDDVIGYTHYGIHKDDFIPLFDGINSLEFCSLGQQKMTYLSLLFAYIKLFRYKFSCYPIVLIDDVSGELDKFRWQKLVGFLGRSDFQVLITTANEAFKEELEKIAGTRKISVDAGCITYH